jgi:hypothetical protein
MSAGGPCVVVLLGAAVLAACGSSPLRPSVDAADSGIGPENSAPASIGGAADSAPDGALDDRGSRVLRVVEPVHPTGDRRLTSFAVGNPGASQDGWDNCWGPPTPLSRAPQDCVACPAPSSGASYLRYTGPIPPCDPTSTNCQVRSDSQIYGYFTPALAAGSPQGVWFELVHIGGDPGDASLTLYATDEGCATLETLGTWGMADVLSRASEWTFTCASVTPHQPTPGIGFTFSGRNIDLGMEGPWFGPPCPAP